MQDKYRPPKIESLKLVFWKGHYDCGYVQYLQATFETRWPRLEQREHLLHKDTQHLSYGSEVLVPLKLLQFQMLRADAETPHPSNGPAAVCLQLQVDLRISPDNDVRLFLTISSSSTFNFPVENSNHH